MLAGAGAQQAPHHAALMMQTLVARRPTGMAAGFGVMHTSLAVFKSSLAHLSSRLAVVQRADSGGYERACQAEAAAGMVHLLSLVQEWSDEAAIKRFMLTGFARHFIAAGPAADGSGGDCVEGRGPMLAALLLPASSFAGAARAQLRF